MPEVPHGGHRADECISESGGILAMWTMWLQVGSDAPRDGCCLRHLGFGASTTRPALNRSDASPRTSHHSSRIARQTAGPRRISAALHLSRTSLCLERRPHVRADRVAAGVCAAGGRAPGAGLVDQRRWDRTPRRGGMDGGEADRNAEPAGSTRHIRAPAVTSGSERCSGYDRGRSSRAGRP